MTFGNGTPVARHMKVTESGSVTMASFGSTRKMGATVYNQKVYCSNTDKEASVHTGKPKVIYNRLMFID